MSHTAQIAADYSHTEALERAVRAIGGHLGGQGTHCLYGSRETGMAIVLPGWNYPIVVRADNTLAYDDFNGAWGNVSDLDRLHEEYSWALTEIAAQSIGWQCERIENGVRVYHPSGGTITVTQTTVDLAGFTGGMCAEAMRQLALPTENVQAKPSMGCIVAQCQEAE